MNAPRRKLQAVVLLVSCLAVVPAGAVAQEESGEESRLRPLSPDRPDMTESPHSVDRGHFQLEMDLLSSVREQGDATLLFGVSNLKLGVADFLDLQLVLRPLVSTPPVVPDGPRGLGYFDPIVRVKIAVYGNDEGPFALGLLPWLRIPVPGSVGQVDASGAVDRAWEAGLAVPMGADLPWELSLAPWSRST